VIVFDVLSFKKKLILAEELPLQELPLRVCEYVRT
jgi:hypothetical protein